MTRLRNIVLGGLAAVAIGGAVSSALAEETGSFQNRLNGATEGLPLAAAPPPGLYTGLATVFLGYIGSGGPSTGNAAGGARLFLPAVAQAVPLLYVPGWNFLGASYSMSAVQAFYTFLSCGANPCGLGSNPGAAPIAGGGFVYANTLWNPIALSWNLGQGFFVGAGFNFMAPDGTKNQGTPNPDYWTFEPTFAVAYLSKSWVLAANFFYDINTVSRGACCAAPTAAGTVTGGNALYGDFTALYQFGKWQIGPVGYFEAQTTSDTGPGCPALCGNYSTVAIGGLVGYDFGPVSLQVWVTGQVEGANTPAGAGAIDTWMRMSFRLWAPEAPKPLVAKN
jgi:hypothetical protein